MAPYGIAMSRVRGLFLLGSSPPAITLADMACARSDRAGLTQENPVPKPKTRKKAVYTPPQTSQQVKMSPRWLAPVMVASWIIGILWIAVYYVAPTAPGIGA